MSTARVIASLPTHTQTQTQTQIQTQTTVPSVDFGLDEAVVRLLPGICERLKLVAGEVISRSLDADATYLLVLEGTLRSNGGGVGLTNTHWPSDVIALDAFADGSGGHWPLRAVGGEAQCLVLRGSTIDALRGVSPELGERLAKGIALQRQRARIAAMLRLHLPELDEAALRALADAFEVRELDAGEQLSHAAEPVDRATLLLSGRFELLEPSSVLPERPVPGTLVDVDALLAPVARGVALRAVRPGQVAELRRDVLLRQARLFPSVNREVLDLLLGSGAPRSLCAPAGAFDSELVCVVRLGDAPGSHTVLEHLRTCVGSGTRCAVFDATCARDGVDVDGSLQSWQHAAQAQFDALHCVFDDSQGGAIERMLEQADRVIFVAAAELERTSTLARRHLWQNIERPLGTTHLLLVHDDAAEAPVCWPRTAILDQAHAFRAGDADAWSRALRIATGRGRALVLTGADARALAGLGVLEALAAQGLAVDFVAGAGSGAGVAGLVAQAEDVSDVPRTLRRLTRSAGAWLPWGRFWGRGGERRTLTDVLEANGRAEVVDGGWQPATSLRDAHGAQPAIESLPALVARAQRYCAAEDVWVLKLRTGRVGPFARSKPRLSTCERTGARVIELPAGRRRAVEVGAVASLVRTARQQVEALLAR